MPTRAQVLWLCLFCAVFTQGPYIAHQLFTPFEKLNIFMLSVVTMLRRDLVRAHALHRALSLAGRGGYNMHSMHVCA